MSSNLHNILLTQISNDENFSLNEYIPPITSKGINVLSFSENISWSNIIPSENIILSYDTSGNILIDCSINAFEGTEMYYSDGRLGFGRNPLHNYKIDLSVPENTVSTALHIGDGTYGFSFGNATSQGFLPQIVGIGSDENDAGLYFLGKTIKEDNSKTPVIIFDGRRSDDTPLQKRPILGISSGSYDKFDVLVQCNGKVELQNDLRVEGDVIADDILISTIDENISLIKEINDLRDRIDNLEELIIK